MNRRTTVAAAMIVRNEEAFLPGCLASLVGLVDDIVVVDTGSSDRTIAIARDSGARVLHHRWAQDFGVARNIGLDAACSDWILYIDADERLHNASGGRLGDCIDPGAVGHFVRFRPKTGSTRYRECRLFRNDPRIRFSGAIHETPLPAILAVCRDEGVPIGQTAIEIDHFGYDGDQSQKHARNLPMLEAAVRTHPDRVYYWYHLTETLAALGRPVEATAAARQGLASADRDDSDKQRADASLIVQALARFQMAQSEDPIPMIDAGLARVPDDFGLLYLRACALVHAGRSREALEAARALRKIDPDLLTDGLLSFDRGIFREKAAEIEALACLRLGRRAEAAAHFAAVARMLADARPPEPARAEAPRRAS